MKPTIIVIFHNSSIQNGGTRSLMDIIMHLNEMQKYNFKAIFPTKKGSCIDKLREIGINDIRFYRYGDLMQDLNQKCYKRLIKFPILCIRWLRVIFEAWKASKNLKDEFISIVYSNTSSIVFGGYLGLFLRVKQIWHIREFRIKDHRIKFFLGERWLKQFINKCSDKVLFVSKSVMEENTDIIPLSKCVVTYNSYSCDYICPKDYFNFEESMNVLIAGDIKPSKGQLLVIEAVEKLLKNGISIKLFIAGHEGNHQYYERIRKYIDVNTYLSKNVFLLGQVSDMKALRVKMDVGVVASDNEAFGRTVIEGMLSMMAMIGSNSGGTTEQIKDGITGLLYDGCADDLSNKIMLLYKDRELMRRLAINGYKESVDLYTKGHCYELVDQAIQSIL